MTKQGGKTYEKWNAYGQSKSANMLFSMGLAKRFGDRGVLSYSLNPGAIMTNLAAHFDFGPGGDIETLGKLISRGCLLGVCTGLLTVIFFFPYRANLSINWITVWLG